MHSKLSPDLIRRRLTSFFPAALIEDIAHERDVVQRHRTIDITLIYAWFPEGERPSLPVTGAWESIKLLGAVSDTDDTFFLPCEPVQEFRLTDLIAYASDSASAHHRQNKDR